MLFIHSYFLKSEMFLSLVSWQFAQVLPWSRRRSPGVRHRETLDVRKCRALAEGAAGPRRQQHCHHAGGQQKRSTPPEGSAHG